MEQEIIRFVKTPQKGDKVKVYCDMNKILYGFVDNISIQEKYDKPTKSIYKIEIANLIKSDKHFALKDCKFFLEFNKVNFI